MINIKRSLYSAYCKRDKKRYCANIMNFFSNWFRPLNNIYNSDGKYRPAQLLNGKGEL